MASQIRMQQAAKISKMGKTHFMISSSHVLQTNSVCIPCLGHVSGEYHHIWIYVAVIYSVYIYTQYIYIYRYFAILKPMGFTKMVEVWASGQLVFQLPVDVVKDLGRSHGLSWEDS